MRDGAISVGEASDGAAKYRPAPRYSSGAKAAVSAVTAATDGVNQTADGRPAPRYSSGAGKIGDAAGGVAAASAGGINSASKDEPAPRYSSGAGKIGDTAGSKVAAGADGVGPIPDDEVTATTTDEETWPETSRPRMQEAKLQGSSAPKS